MTLAATKVVPRYCVSCRRFIGYANTSRHTMYCGDPFCLVRGPLPCKDENADVYPFVLHAQDSWGMTPGEVEAATLGEVTRSQARSFAVVRNKRVEQY